MQRLMFAWLVIFSAVLISCSSPRKESTEAPVIKGSPLADKIPLRLKENYEYFYHPGLAAQIIESVDVAMAQQPAQTIPLNKWLDGQFEFEKPMVYLDKNKFARSAFAIYQVPVKKGEKYTISFSGKPTKAFTDIFDKRYTVLVPVIQFSDRSIKPITTKNEFKPNSIAQTRMRISWEITAPKSENLKLFLGSMSLEILNPNYSQLKNPNKYSVWFPGGENNSTTPSTVYFGSSLSQVVVGGAVNAAFEHTFYPIQDVIGEYEIQVSD